MWVRRKTRSENVKCCVCGPFVGVMRSDESVKLLNITRINFSETGVVRLDIFSAFFDSRDIRYYFRFAEVSGSEW